MGCSIEFRKRFYRKNVAVDSMREKQSIDIKKNVQNLNFVGPVYSI